MPVTIIVLVICTKFDRLKKILLAWSYDKSRMIFDDFGILQTMASENAEWMHQGLKHVISK